MIACRLLISSIAFATRSGASSLSASTTERWATITGMPSTVARSSGASGLPPVRET